MSHSRSTRQRLLALFLLAVIASPALLLVATQRDQTGLVGGILLLAASAVGACLIVLLHTVLPRAGWLAATTVALLAVAYDAYIVGYQWTPSPGALSLITETNPAEAGDLVGSLPVGFMLAAAVVLVTGAAGARYRSAVLSRAVAGRVFGIFLALLVVVGVVSMRTLDPINLSEAIVQKPGHEQRKSVEDLLLASFPTGVPWLVNRFVHERRSIRDEYERNRSYRFNVSRISTSDHARRVFVMIVGESTRADRLGINGYTRDTTPRLALRQDVVSYTRMYSPHTVSRLAVPLLLTRKPPGSHSATFNQPSIVSAFKQAGFHTVWVSMQAPVGPHDSPISVLAYEADELYFLNPIDYREKGHPDADSLQRLRAVLDDGTMGDTFIVIHTLGSHFRYSDRYPRSFARYLPDRPPPGSRFPEARLFAPEDKPLLSNGYDNTVLYLDFFLDSAIQMLASKPDTSSWLFYASDHGEALFDGCVDVAGHGYELPSNYSVASIFWSSPRFTRERPASVQAMHARRHELLSTAMGFETLADLGGLRMAAPRPDNSVAGVSLRRPAEVLKAERPLPSCPTPNASRPSSVPTR